TPTVHFRKLVNEVTLLLTYEATKNLPTEDVEVETPLEFGRFPRISGKKVAVCPILRAGVGMLDGVLSLISSARVGFIGMYRDEETLQPVEYYAKLPADVADRDVILLDPMLATGNSTAAAVETVKRAGATSVRLIAIIAAPEGIERIHRDHPDVQIVVAAIDRGLNERGFNRSTVPRLGGLALFFGVFVPALAFLNLSGETRGLLLGAAVATTVGAIDDFRGLRWWEKLSGQLAAAAIPVGFGIWVHRFTFPIVGVHTLPKWFGMPVSVLWIVAIMNMVNFLDGLDGLAAGVSAISAFTFTLIALSIPHPAVQAAILSAVVLGAALGFLRHNLYPARIFMGD